jgi:hypothetical protein
MSHLSLSPAWMMSRAFELESMFISFIWQFGHFHVIAYTYISCEAEGRKGEEKIMLFLLNHIALVLINSIQFMKHCRKRDRSIKKTKMLAFFCYQL